LDKEVGPDDCIGLVDGFFSEIIEFFAQQKHSSKFLFFPKPRLLGYLYERMQTVQTNNYIFLIVSEKEIDISAF